MACLLGLSRCDTFTKHRNNLRVERAILRQRGGVHLLVQVSGKTKGGLLPVGLRLIRSHTLLEQVTVT